MSVGFVNAILVVGDTFDKPNFHKITIEPIIAKNLYQENYVSHFLVKLKPAHNVESLRQTTLMEILVARENRLIDGDILQPLFCADQANIISESVY
jgi:hypothetical protein